MILSFWLFCFFLLLRNFFFFPNQDFYWSFPSSFSCAERERENFFFFNYFWHVAYKIKMTIWHLSYKELLGCVKYKFPGIQLDVHSTGVTSPNLINQFLISQAEVCLLNQFSPPPSPKYAKSLSNTNFIDDKNKKCNSI